MLTAQGATWEFGSARLEDRAAVLADFEKVRERERGPGNKGRGERRQPSELSPLSPPPRSHLPLSPTPSSLSQFKPTHVLNAAGVTGRPNVDWCEDHKIETIRANVLGTLTLADVAHLAGAHLTIFATGCIFAYDDAHPLGSGKGFTEDDTPNFTGSYYSFTKALTESLLRQYPGALVLRVRMPIVGDLTYPRNFITKILTYNKIVDIPNSMTVLPDLLPHALDMARRRVAGIMNFTNPGAISHNQIMELYKEYVDPELTWTNFTLEEQAKVIVAPRSNNEMDTARFASECPSIMPIRDALIKHVFEPAAAHKEEVAPAVRKLRGR